MSFEVKIPALQYAMGLVKGAMSELDSGTGEPAEIKKANARLNGARVVQGIVRTDFMTRLGATKLAMQEAKLVESMAEKLTSLPAA